MRIRWDRLLRYAVNMSVWSVLVPGTLSGELMECWLLRQPENGDRERPLSRAERRKWVALVERIDLPDHPR